MLSVIFPSLLHVSCICTVTGQLCLRTIPHSVTFKIMARDRSLKCSERTRPNVQQIPRCRSLPKPSAATKRSNPVDNFERSNLPCAAGIGGIGRRRCELKLHPTLEWHFGDANNTRHHRTFPGTAPKRSIKMRYTWAQSLTAVYTPPRFCPHAESEGRSIVMSCHSGTSQERLLQQFFLLERGSLA